MTVGRESLLEENHNVAENYHISENIGNGNNKNIHGNQPKLHSKKFNPFIKYQKHEPHRPAPSVPNPKLIKHRDHGNSDKIGKKNPQKEHEQGIHSKLSKKNSWWSGRKKESNVPAATTSVVTTVVKPQEILQDFNTSPMKDFISEQQQQQQHKQSLQHHMQLTHVEKKNLPRTKSWFSKSHNRSPSLVLQSGASSESEDQLDLLSTESTEQNANNLTNLIKRLEEDDSIPIVFSQYSGESVFKRNISTPTIFKTQVSKFHKFDKFEESSYNLWNVWTIDEETNQKKIERLIECKSDFIEFFKNFNYSKCFIMKSNLVPNILQFKNGYLVKLKLLHGKTSTNTELGLNLFMKCCKYSILNSIPNNSIKINVCGFTYHKKRQLTQIVLWIHPILNMSFDISNQVKLLIKSFNFGHNLNKITLVDINNNSKTVVSVDVME
ncbi:uncharacterized protein KGF55_001448 [Candida pseudojiufengensis]|uniref:uncharacterized protein n=1 Tax=Candida pseudojiufengensis TaxID=497109 RepID=UPI002224E9BD|nr:uncharacterized protein KGF55_001448 [Candida pseudojiufengensis]KAI5965228.1 hypothetical protein KGF55_001448 [Candida pseudojiufengensis]